jgi:hypothetical protein
MAKFRDMKTLQKLASPDRRSGTAPRNHLDLQISEGWLPRVS